MNSIKVIVNKINLDKLSIFNLGLKGGSKLSLKGILDLSGPGTWIRAVHLVATEDINDLSDYGIGVANNGESSDDYPQLILSGSASEGNNILVARSNIEDTQTVFDSYLNASNTFDNIQIFNDYPNFNGNDVVELYFENSVCETYGVVGEDGTGEVWEYVDTWAWKNEDDNWTTAELNCTDGSYYIWDSGCVYPFLVGKQSAGTWDPVTAFEHDMSGIGPANVWFLDSEVSMSRVTSNPVDNEVAMRYIDDGTNPNSNMQIRFKSKIDITAMNTYTMDVLIDSASTGSQTNQLTLKLQNATEDAPWMNQNVVTQAITPDVWNTLSFVFNDDASMARRDVDSIVIQFNGENNNDSVTGYIKNVVGSYTRQPLDLNSDGKVDVLDIVFAFNNNSKDKIEQIVDSILGR